MKCYVHPYLQGECQSDEVHHHLFVRQLHAEKTQQSIEGLIVLLAAALFFTAKVDVSAQVLAMLQVEVNVLDPFIPRKVQI